MLILFAAPPSSWFSSVFFLFYGQLATSRFCHDSEDADWLLSDRTGWLELGKMDVQHVRPEISAIQLLRESTDVTFHQLFDSSLQAAEIPGIVCVTSSRSSSSYLVFLLRLGGKLFAEWEVWKKQWKEISGVNRRQHLVRSSEPEEMKESKIKRKKGRNKNCKAEKGAAESLQCMLNLNP